MKRVTVTSCNICGSGAASILCASDRYGFNSRAAMCLSCGLIYNVDRFTPESYSRFYFTGTYRNLIGAFKGVPQSIERIDRSQVAYADMLVKTFEGIVPPNHDGTLLDIGGSTGRISSQFQRRFGYRPTILEPSREEVEKAMAQGVHSIVGSLETWVTEEKFDIVLLCRTIEHLYDLRQSLEKIRTLLKPGGLLFCDIADFLEIVRREGPPEATTKIDHVFWLTQETAVTIFRKFGLELVTVQLTLPPDQVGFLLRAVDSIPFQPVGTGWIQEQLRFFREVTTNWNDYGAQPMDVRDFLRQGAFRLKRTLRRW